MKDTRRQFIQTSMLASSWGVFSRLLNEIPGKKDQLGEGILINPEEQETYLIAGRQAPVTIMISKGLGIDSFSFCKEEIISQDFIPVHKHLHEEEIIFVQDGQGIIVLGHKKFTVKSGSVAFIPKDTWHGLKNTGDKTLTMIFSYCPAGFENYFKEIGVLAGTPYVEKTPQEYQAIDRKYGIQYKYNPPSWE